MNVCKSGSQLITAGVAVNSVICVAFLVDEFSSIYISVLYRVGQTSCITQLYYFSVKLEVKFKMLKSFLRNWHDFWTDRFMWLEVFEWKRPNSIENTMEF